MEYLVTAEAPPAAPAPVGRKTMTASVEYAARTVVLREMMANGQLSEQSNFTELARRLGLNRSTIGRHYRQLKEVDEEAERVRAIIMEKGDLGTSWTHGAPGESEAEEEKVQEPTAKAGGLAKAHNLTRLGTR